MEGRDIQTLLERLAGIDSEPVQVARGDVLFRQGDVGDSFYIVRSGRLRAIYNWQEEGERILGEVGRGEPVGELALLDEGVRSATLVAIRDSELAKISEETFDKLTETHPREVIELTRVVAERLKESYETGITESLPSSIAVIPAVPDVPLTRYCRRLSLAMEEGGHRSAVLSSRDLPAELDGGKESQKTARWIDEQEAKSATTVLESDATLTPWTHKCLRHADLVLVLGQSGKDPNPGEIERALGDLSQTSVCPRVHLVLLHEGQPPYTGTAAWLENRNVARHYHLRMDSERGRARARRLLTGTDMTLVLGGGGARGFGHIGVYRALCEAGIPVDRVGGTSMGAGIGGLIAMGMEWEEIAQRCRERFVDAGRLRSLTLPAVSVDTGRRYIRTLNKMFGDVLIEDLPVNYFCVSCNLTKAEQIIHRSGLLAKWVASSMSIPGVVPPLVVDGDMYVDGGVLNNVPVDIAHADGAGKVIAVDVSPDVELALPDDYNGRPGAFEALRSRLPGRNPIPGMFAILNRVCNMSSLTGRTEFRDLAHLFLKLPVSDFKTFDWAHIDEIIERGYRHASEKIAEWQDV